MKLTHLTLIELRQLIRSERVDPYHPTNDGQIKCVCSTDLFYEVEIIQKRGTNPRALGSLKTRSCNLFAAMEYGYVQMLDLDQYSLEHGLFENIENSYNFEIWQSAVSQRSDPAQSARMVSLKAFDKSWGSNLCETFQTL